MKNDREIVDEALVKAVSLLSITEAELSEITNGYNKGTPSDETQQLDWEANLIVIDVCLKLMKLSNSAEYSKLFIRSENKYFKDKPINLMKTHNGLKEVQTYLRSMLAK